MRLDFETEDFVTYGIPGNWIGRKPENGGNAVEPMHDVAPCLTKTDQYGVCAPIAFNQQASVAQGLSISSDVVPTLDKSKTHGICYDNVPKATIYLGQDVYRPMAVRRLTPTECERLQGFPDGYTKISDKTPDSPRYKALGNSMAVPVMRWIGERIEKAVYEFEHDAGL